MNCAGSRQQPGGFTVEVVNNNNAMVMTGMRVQVGTQAIERAPSYIEIFGRTMQLNMTRSRWFDFPFTREEALQADKKLSIFSKSPMHSIHTAVFIPVMCKNNLDLCAVITFQLVLRSTQPASPCLTPLRFMVKPKSSLAGQTSPQKTSLQLQSITCAAPTSTRATALETVMSPAPSQPAALY